MYLSVSFRTYTTLPRANSQFSKKLYDAVDNKAKRGWSLKTILIKKTLVLPGQELEFVIQRADIFKKYKQLGFEQELNRDSNILDLGKAIVRHWNNKVDSDSQSQGVIDGRLAVLVKNKERQQYIYIEQSIQKFDANDYNWVWTDAHRIGLQAKQKTDGKVLLRWYANQKQLFQALTIPQNPVEITITPKRSEVDKFVESVLESLD